MSELNGYGRWVALLILLVWLIIANYEDYKKDKMIVLIPALYLFLASATIAILVLIVNFW